MINWLIDFFRIDQLIDFFRIDWLIDFFRVHRLIDFFRIDRLIDFFNTKRRVEIPSANANCSARGKKTTLKSNQCFFLCISIDTRWIIFLTFLKLFSGLGKIASAMSQRGKFDKNNQVCKKKTCFMIHVSI